MMETYDFSELASQVIQIAGIILSVMVAWVMKWAKAHFESKIMRDNMDRLNDTIQNGISRGVTQGQEVYAGKALIHKSKYEIVNSAMLYTRDHSQALINASGYSDEKLRGLIESKLPEIVARSMPPPIMLDSGSKVAL